MKKILACSRPRFWIYIIGPFLLPLAIYTNQIFEHIVPLSILFVYCTFPANILIYGINDLYDQETDAYNPKKESYESRLQNTQRKKLWYVIACSQIPFFVYLGIMAPSVCTYAVIFFVLCAWQYSAPPLRAKARPFVDSLCSGILYVIPALFSWSIFVNTMPPLLPLVAAFLWSYAMHAYSAIPDIQADTTAGVATSATLLGKNTMLAICTLLYASASVIAFKYIGACALFAGLVYVICMYASYRTQKESDLLRLYTFFPYINTIVGALLCALLYIKFS